MNTKFHAIAARNAYRAIDDSPAGYNVNASGEGMLIQGIPQRWAARAAELLNGCETREAQMAELARIRGAIRSRA